MEDEITCCKIFEMNKTYYWENKGWCKLCKFLKNLFTVAHKLILRLRVTIFNVMITVEIAVVFYTKIEYKTKHLYRIYLGVIKL